MADNDQRPLMYVATHATDDPTLATLPAGFGVGSDGSVRDASGNQALAGTTRLPNGNLISTTFGSFGSWKSRA